MMKQNQLLLAAALVLGATGFSVSAQTPIFTTGPINGTLDAWNLTSGYEEASSFTLTDPATIGNATFGLWVATGETLTSVDWAITSSVGGTPLPSAAGTVIPTSTLLTSDNSYGYDIYSESFSIPSIALGAGTYYLQLDNGVTTSSSSAYWDENDGANSTGYIYDTSAWQTLASEIPGSVSLAFTLSGATSVPEPGTLALAGMGALALGRLARRRAGK